MVSTGVCFGRLASADDREAVKNENMEQMSGLRRGQPEDYRPSYPVGRSSSRSPAWVSHRDGLTTILRRAWRLLRAEGLAGLVSGSGQFLAELWRRVFRCETYRLYEFRVDDAALLPLPVPSEEIEMRMVETREDARRLVAEGYEDVMSTVPLFERRLDSGAVAACAFVGKEFASIDWMAFSVTAKLSFDQRPYKVDFAKGEVCTGGAFTVRRFRRRGIAACRFSRQVQYMHERGCTVYRTATRDDNTPSKRPVERYGGQVRRIGHWRRLLWSTSWTETAVE